MDQNDHFYDHFYVGGRGELFWDDAYDLKILLLKFGNYVSEMPSSTHQMIVEKSTFRRFALQY